MASFDLRDRLKGMLLETPPISASKSRPLIQVLDSEDGKAMTPAIGDRIDLDLKVSVDDEVGDGDNDDCNDSDNEGPPPIFTIKQITPEKSKIEASSSFCPTNSSRLDERGNPDSPSLAEQLLADAALAKEESQKQLTQREKLAAKRSTFGVKRGFLNSTSKKSNRKEKAVTQENSMHMVKKEESKAGEVRIEGRQVSKIGKVRPVKYLSLIFLHSFDSKYVFFHRCSKSSRWMNRKNSFMSWIMMGISFHLRQHLPTATNHTG